MSNPIIEAEEKFKRERAQLLEWLKPFEGAVIEGNTLKILENGDNSFIIEDRCRPNIYVYIGPIYGYTRGDCYARFDDLTNLAYAIGYLLRQFKPISTKTPTELPSLTKALDETIESLKKYGKTLD